MSISSFVIHSHPDNVSGLNDRLKSMDGIDVHTITDEGRFVVTLDQPDDRKAGDIFTELQALNGVLNISLVYNYSEQGLAEKEHTL